MPAQPKKPIDWSAEIRTRFDSSEMSDFFGRFNELEIPADWFAEFTHTKSSDPAA